jgi:hypothetical protein
LVFGDAVIPPPSAGPLAGLTRELSFGACRRGPESRRVSCLTAITPCCDDVAVLLRRDEHVLVSTRLLALVIIPFLLGAFVILYGFPRHTARLFAWPIKPTMTSMMLASAYLGGAYFFVRVFWERHWNVIKGGFVPVVLFAGLLGVATVLHWDVFSHQHVTFWIWATLYFTTPFLVFGAWLANRRTAAAPAAKELRLSRPARWVVGVIGFLAPVQGLVMFLAPGLVAPFWPWSRFGNSWRRRVGRGRHVVRRIILQACGHSIALSRQREFVVISARHPTVLATPARQTRIELRLQRFIR